jgi:hypothetical protein
VWQADDQPVHAPPIKVLVRLLRCNRYQLGYSMVCRARWLDHPLPGGVAAGSRWGSVLYAATPGRLMDRVVRKSFWCR